MNAPRSGPRRGMRRGISLIEALVAMAVMAFGMLGVVGMQATLRGNADLSKQRTEAMRIAQERMEELRDFSVLDTTAGTKAFADKASFAATAVTGYTTNTAYTVTGSVTPAGAANQKTLTIDVTWTDRSNTPQSVRLVSAMARIAPELSGSLVVSAQGAGGVREPEGRRRGIPPQAKNFGDGTSGFRPPTNPGNVAWVFNNVTGIITSVCTTSAATNAALTLASLTACDATQSFQLISGYIRFSTGFAQPTVAQVTDPTDGPGLTPNAEVEVLQTAPSTGTRDAASGHCFHGTASTYIEYFCAIPVATPTPASWAGTLQIKASTLATPNGITLSPNLADTTATGRRKVCRYRAAASYTGVNAPLSSENLILIRPGDNVVAYTCPSPPTFAHQPAT
ncbi:MAG: prepilin-type N-terminal cleavage/methylation domain-containing protein [Rubrivivax sp.]|nr:prepilin-type N-terminal cleavage/methylation domain-containing protein [Rubrivivax sp.]